MATTKALLIALVLAVLIAAASGSPVPATNLTLLNMCSYPVWPLITPNVGLPDIPDVDAAANRLDANGEGVATLRFPPGAWSGRIVPRTGCTDDEESDSSEPSISCVTGAAPPFTVAQVSVHGAGGLAGYSVSLVDGFNVPVVVTPHGFEPGSGHGLCPALGCAVDLAVDCPGNARARGGGCRPEARYFKDRCPDTRTTPTDVEATPQSCVEPRELRVVFCPPATSK